MQASPRLLKVGIPVCIIPPNIAYGVMSSTPGLPLLLLQLLSYNCMLAIFGATQARQGLRLRTEQASELARYPIRKCISTPLALSTNSKAEMSGCARAHTVQASCLDTRVLVALALRG